jgi:amino acid permease
MDPVAEQKPRRGSKVSVSNGPPDSADQLLETMGYKAELSRNRSTFQVAFMSFVLASIPYGLATTLAYPLIGGGPVNVIWGWLAVSMIIVCVAASLGEITSVYPTAGGTYQLLSPTTPCCMLLVSSKVK